MLENKLKQNNSMDLWSGMKQTTGFKASGSQCEEFVNVLAYKQAKEGDDFILRCEANIVEVTATWEKNGHALECVEGKHSVTQSGTTFSLIIRNVAEQDEGSYTLNLLNEAGSASCSAMVTVVTHLFLTELNEWRDVQWNQSPLITALQNFKISNRKVRELRFLLVGPIGAGKSSIINTIKSIFAGHQFINCLAASDLMDFTITYQKHTIGTLPFAFCDMMGIESDKSQGVHTDDIVSALKGHMPNNYKFNPSVPMCEDHKNQKSKYIRNPSVNDQIHCLVNVIPAYGIMLLDNKVIQKMKTVRAEASKLGIPQLVFMTNVDKACRMTYEDLAKVYQSKKIKEKMEECSTRLGVPMNCIFPLKNYHEETKLIENLNCLMLEAFTQAVYSAHEYVTKCSH
ncbi:hypothetical protein SRHO_G00113920 [Serrasalmus rhombeus]